MDADDAPAYPHGHPYGRTVEVSEVEVRHAA
jgi:hypothetical protein